LRRHFLPGLTFNGDATGSPYERVSDAAVAYDALHGAWLISSIPITSTVATPTVFVNRSTDDGLTWSNPIAIPPPVSNSVDLDKNWTVCDNVSASFGPLLHRARHVIVPFRAFNGQIQAYYSDDGGASWSAGKKIDNIRLHPVAGNLRTSPLPSAEVAADGTVYVAWEDCRFRKGCTSNDIVFSRSSDGVTWSDPARVPIDDVTSTVDHFIPGLAVDPATSGASTHLALTYYFYPASDCGSSCSLEAAYVSSPDEGAHWGDPTQLAGPMSLGDIALTSQGTMVGDYISTSFTSSGRATTLLAVGNPHTGSSFDEAMYAPATLLAVATPAEAMHPSSTAGVVVQVNGVGTGESHHSLKND